MKTLDDQLPVTPVGRPATVAPVAATVLYVMFVMAEFTQTVCALVPAPEDNVIEDEPPTVIVIALLVAGEPLAHPKLLLMLTVI